MIFLLGVPVKWVGVGQARDAMILRSDSWSGAILAVFSGV
jgi:hypothetical protein